MGSGGDVDQEEGPTKLEQNAEALGYHPRDPDEESYHAWEYGFIQHCVRTQGKFVHRHHDWFVEQGFRPVMLDTFIDVAHQPRRTGRRPKPMLSDWQWGLIILGIIALTLVGLYILIPDEYGICLIILVVESVLLILNIAPRDD